MKIAFIAFIAIMLILNISFSFKAKRRLRYFLIYSLSGLGIYIALCIIGNLYEPIKLNLNMFNLAVSTACGPIGALFLLALKFLL